MPRKDSTVVEPKKAAHNQAAVEEELDVVALQSQPQWPILGATQTPPPPTPEQLMEFERSPGHFIKQGRGFQAPGFPPPPAFTNGLGPQSAHQLEPPLPVGTKATHFSGPLVSGGIAQTPLWRQRGSIQGSAPIGGTPILTTTLSVDYSMGNFTVTTQFPPDSLIISFAGVTAVPFTASPTFQLGRLSGASDIISGGTFPAPGGPITFQPATGQLPLWDATGLQRPFQAFLTVNGNTGGAAGLGFILIQFVRIPQRWT